MQENITEIVLLKVDYLFLDEDLGSLIQSQVCQLVEQVESVERQMNPLNNFFPNVVHFQWLTIIKDFLKSFFL